MSDDRRSPRTTNLPLLLAAAGAMLLLALGVAMGGAYAFLRWCIPDPSEGRMEFSLPASGESRVRAEEGDSERPRLEDLKAEVTIVLRGARDGADKGNLQEIVVRAPDGAISLRNLEELSACLKMLRAKLTNKNDIQIEAESKLRYAYIIDAMDTCVKEGFTRVGFSPPPDAEK
jgi:Biopolymer transport protein ExbD/TolR